MSDSLPELWDIDRFALTWPAPSISCTGLRGSVGSASCGSVEELRFWAADVA